MIYGLITSCFSFYSLNETLKLCEWLVCEAKLESVEISMAGNPYGRTGPELFPWEIHGEEKGLILDLLNLFKVKGAHLPFLNLALICRNQRIEKESMYQLKLGIEKSSELDLDYVVVHLIGNVERASKEFAWKSFKDKTLELLDHAKDHGTLLTLENVDFLHNLDDLTAMTKELNDPNLGITLDIGHAYLPVNGEKPYSKFGTVKNYIEMEGKRIKNVHAHDYDGQMDHLPIGFGIINFRDIMSALSQTGYNGPINFEFGPRRLKEKVKGMRNPPSDRIISERGLMVYYIIQSVKRLKKL